MRNFKLKFVCLFLFRPIYISQCDPSKKKAPVFKYTTGLEKNKLFVKGNTLILNLLCFFKRLNTELIH